MKKEAVFLRIYFIDKGPLVPKKDRHVSDSVDNLKSICPFLNYSCRALYL